MEDGDFVKINFEMRLGNEKKLVATNVEKLAKDNDIYDPDTKYKESVIIVGSEGIFKEINESLKSSEVGKETEIFIPMADAYGARDPNNVKIHTMREFQKNKIDPIPGQEVRINNRRGKVISVSPGRVLVDYNHHWAGKDLFYKYIINEKIESSDDKANAIIDMNYSKGASNFKISVDDSIISVTLPEDAKFDIEWIDAKFRIVDSIRKHFSKYKLMIIEEYLPKLEPEKVEENNTEDKKEISDEEKSNTN
ncbi:MAG: FKBP-type peptidyl-prolyl cis-trans isomerase [Thermoplasmataceae archaeon]